MFYKLLNQINMKMKLFLLLVIVAASGIIFTSCDKEVESTALTVNISRTITVKGYVYAELNNRSAGLEYAPAGTLLYCSVYYSDLNSSATAGKWADTVVVDENGQFAIDVPVDDNGVNLIIEGAPFEYNQIQPFGANSNTVKKLYLATTVTKIVSTTYNSIVEVFYTATLLANYVEKVKLNLTVEAELDNSTSGNEKVVSQKITLHNAGWSQEYTTDDNGKITAAVPANENIFYTISFEYDKKVPDGTGYKTEKYKYEAKTAFLGSFASETDVTIDLGGGVPVP